MASDGFRTSDGRSVPAVTAEGMREVDRAAEEIGLPLLSMMENAGRALAWHVRSVADGDGSVTVLAGSGGNGGGGLVCARRLANRGVTVEVVLDRSGGDLDGAAGRQYDALSAMDVPIGGGTDGFDAGTDTTVVDALVGYGLDGSLEGTAADLVRAIPDDRPVVALDVPSGLDATTGEQPGPAVAPDRTVTLALPKTGLRSAAGDLYLADIAIPAVAFRRSGIDYESPFGEQDWIGLSHP